MQLLTANGFSYLLCLYVLFGLVGFFVLNVNRIQCKKINLIYLLSIFFHMLACVLFSMSDSDSYHQFFLDATPYFTWYGTEFVKWLTWYVRYYIAGDSYLGAVAFFSGFGLLGQVVYVLIFDRISLYLAGHDLCAARKSIWPYAVILLWPSYILWTCGVGKDSLCFFGIAICIYSVINIAKNPLRYGLYFILAFTLIFMIRPYLFLVFGSTFCFAYVLLNKKVPFLFKFTLFVVLAVSFYLLLPTLMEIGRISTFSYDSVVNRSYVGLVAQSKGTAIPVPTDNPHLLPLFLPWTMFANGFLPLFYPMYNVKALFASIENLVFLWFIFNFIKHRGFYKQIIQCVPLLKLGLYFFLSGLGLLAILNTNLGLAMRQKTMYTPTILILCCLTILVAKHHRRKPCQKSLS